MQKVRERISDYENHLKGKESSEKEDPHPELAYIRPGDGKGEATANAQEGKQHGGLPTASLGKDVPTDVTKEHEKHNKSGGTVTYSRETFLSLSLSAINKTNVVCTVAPIAWDTSQCNSPFLKPYECCQEHLHAMIKILTIFSGFM